MSSIRRGWYHGWNIVAVLIVAQMAVSGLTHNTLSMFLKGWSADLHVPVSQLMLGIVAQLLVSAPLSPVVGVLCDRYSLRTLFSIGLLGIAAFFVAISFVNAAWQIIVLYALVAPLLLLCSTTPANALISRWFRRRIGLALGLTAFGMGLGGVLLPPLIAVLLPLVGWRMIWLGAGLLVACIVMPLLLFVVRDAPTEREGLQYVSGDEAPGLPHGHGAARTGELGWRDILTRREFWLLVVIYVVVMGTGSAFHQNVGPYAAAQGFGSGAAALLLSVMSLSHLASTLTLGLLVDRFGCRLPLFGLAIVVAAGLALITLGQGLPLAVVAVALIGFNTGVFTPLAVAMSAEFGANNFGRAFGMAMFFVPLSTPFAYVLARTQEGTGTYTPALVAFVGVLLAAALLALLLKGPSAREAKHDPEFADGDDAVRPQIT
jgi:MFS family permease